LKKKWRNGTIIVIRENNNGDLLNSKPCKNCIEIMKKYCIKNIEYSYINNTIVKEKLKNIKTEHTSKGFRNFFI
jgi:hypothetical protein